MLAASSNAIKSSLLFCAPLKSKRLLCYSIVVMCSLLQRCTERGSGGTSVRLNYVIQKHYSNVNGMLCCMCVYTEIRMRIEFGAWLV